MGKRQPHKLTAEELPPQQDQHEQDGSETETKGPETYSLKIATKGPEINSKDGSSMVAGAEEGERIEAEGEKGSDKSHSHSGTSTVE